MNKIKIWTLVVFAALGLAGCVQEDNSVYERLHTYDQTENFSSAATTQTVDLKYMVGQPVVGEVSADWLTITALPNNGSEPAQVKVSVTANTTNAERSTLTNIKVGEYTVMLTVNQGFTNVDTPNDNPTDNPAYGPGK